MNKQPFLPSKFRHHSSPFNQSVAYDIQNPAVFSEYHVQHVRVTEDEVADLIARATINQRLGTEYVPVDLCPESMRHFHLV